MNKSMEWTPERTAHFKHYMSENILSSKITIKL